MPRELKKRKLFECLNPKCKHRWLGLAKNVKNVLHGAQCVKCFSPAIFCHELIEEHLKEFHQRFNTKEEAEKALDFVAWLYEKGYVTNNKCNELAFKHFIKKVEASY
jgi:hypothetical protein